MKPLYLKKPHSRFKFCWFKAKLQQASCLSAPNLTSMAALGSCQGIKSGQVRFCSNKLPGINIPCQKCIMEFMNTCLKGGIDQTWKPWRNRKLLGKTRQRDSTQEGRKSLQFYSLHLPGLSPVVADLHPVDTNCAWAYEVHVTWPVVGRHFQTELKALNWLHLMTLAIVKTTPSWTAMLCQDCYEFTNLTSFNPSTTLWGRN